MVNTTNPTMIKLGYEVLRLAMNATGGHISISGDKGGVQLQYNQKGLVQSLDKILPGRISYEHNALMVSGEPVGMKGVYLVGQGWSESNDVSIPAQFGLEHEFQNEDVAYWLFDGWRDTNGIVVQNTPKMPLVVQLNSENRYGALTSLEFGESGAIDLLTGVVTGPSELAQSAGKKYVTPEKFSPIFRPVNLLYIEADTL